MTLLDHQAETPRPAAGDGSPVSNFRDQDDTKVTLWNRLQRYQTDFCFGLELPAYYGSASWHGAREVLDIGTGNGYYLDRLSHRFPDKRYHGIDLSAPLIEAAQQEVAREGVTFSCSDLFKLDGRYDFVILRLVLQHLPNPRDALERVLSLTRPGGSALIIDAHDEARFYEPDAPEFMRFFRAYAEHQRHLGLDRQVGERIREYLAGQQAWTTGAWSEIVVPSSVPGNLDLFRRSYGLFIELVESGASMPYDFERVKQEWRWWCGLENAYTQAGLTIVRLDRA